MGQQQCSVSAVSRVESPHHTSYVIADKLLSIHHHHHHSNQTCMHSEICDNSMQATVLDDAMKDDALNDRVVGSVASLDKRKGSIELNIGYSKRPTLGIGCVL